MSSPPQRRTVARQILALVGWLLVSYVAAAVGGIASANAGEFYRQLERPAWAPPGWLFAPVWTVLYGLMGIAAWLVWRERGTRKVRLALSLFLIQLTANALWSWLFFAWKQGAMAFAEVLLLWLLIFATVVAFGRVRRLAATLMIPYLMWVTYASALTYAIWQLNPDLLV